MITAQCPMKTRLKLGNENQPCAGSGKAEQRPAKEGCHERRAAVVIHFPFAHQAHHQRCDEQADPSDGNGLEDTVWKDQGNCKARPDARYQQNEYNQTADFGRGSGGFRCRPYGVGSGFDCVARLFKDSGDEVTQQAKKPQMSTSKRTSKISGAKISKRISTKISIIASISNQNSSWF